MKRFFLVLSLTALGLAGCESTPPADPGIDTSARQQQSIDTWFVDTQTQSASARGILSQRALFAYHFDPGSARLTEIGRRDLAILADYYKTTPGALTLARENASDELYNARTATVRSALKDAGVDTDHVQIVDGYPGGRGTPGQSVVDADKLEKSRSSKEGSTDAYITGGSNSSSSSSSSSGYGDSGMKGSGQ